MRNISSLLFTAVVLAAGASRIANKWPEWPRAIRCSLLVAGAAVGSVAAVAQWATVEMDDGSSAGATSSTVPQELASESSARIEASVQSSGPGSHGWEGRVTADEGDVLAFQVWYYNQENPDSHRFAEALTIGFAQWEPGSERWTATIVGTNTNRIVSSLHVDLPRGMTLKYVPDSTTWRYNRTGTDLRVDYVTVPLPDGVMEGGIVLENAAPCWDCEATVRFEATVEPSQGAV